MVKNIGVAIIISIIFAFPTALLFSFAPNYSEPLFIPNTPIEEYEKLNRREQQEFLRSENGIRPVSKMEKITYLLRATPETYLLKSFILFIPLFLVSLISMLRVGRNEKT